MSPIRALLRDRRRAQQGSVLSGVLIMTAFLAIISGALMTALSGNFLLSRNLMNRATTEATINSAAELAFNQMETTALIQGCPTLNPVSVNNLIAVPTYASCWPTIREAQKFARVGSSSAAFNLDGALALGNGFNDYVVGNSSGSVFDYQFGATSPRWTLAFSGTLTAPPLAVPNPYAATQLDVLPMSASACPSGGNCLLVLSDNNTSSPPSPRCTISSPSGPVVSQPGASPSHGGYVYYAGGTRLAVSDLSGGDCDAISSVTTSASVVAGPVVLRCTGSCGSVSEEIYVVVSDSVSTRLLWYTFSNNLSLAGSLTLPWQKVAGIAASARSSPASIALTFGGGGIALVQLGSNGGMSLLPGYMLMSGISGAPHWCAPCGNLFGVGAQSGALYLFDSALKPAGRFDTGSPISTSPSTDGGGDWYVGTDNGYVHELQLQVGQALAQVETYGQMSQFGSSAQVGACMTGICIYLGGTDGSVYLVPLDARDAAISACISTAPPACSGANPHLWAEVEIGAAGNRQAIHVQGWSYYST